MRVCSAIGLGARDVVEPVNAFVRRQMRYMAAGPVRLPPQLPLAVAALLSVACLLAAGCHRGTAPAVTELHWYVFNEPSGAFARVARECSAAAAPAAFPASAAAAEAPTARAYTIRIVPLPADADQQREQLVRRLAAGDDDIDLMGMDVIWTAEFGAAGWLSPWTDAQAAQVTGRLEPTLESARWRGRLWAVPFTTNAQLLWYRTDRVARPPATWDEMLREAEAIGPAAGTIEAQGARYEGLSVLFVSLLRSAGGRLLDESGTKVALPAAATHEALEIMRRFAISDAAPPNLAVEHEDEARLGFESGRSAFMLNYPFVWPSAHETAPEVARNMAWARWPRARPDLPSRVTLGGINIGVSAFSRHARAAHAAALCLASAEHQRLAARLGGLPPTLEALYDDPDVRARFPFADTLRETVRDAVQRPATPLWSDVSLAISHTLHPMRSIDPDETQQRLREAVERALASEGLL
jgi:multiple sugar transport system substrate-binding protein